MEAANLDQLFPLLPSARSSTKRIIVREVQGKSGQFDYLVQGVPKGYENHQVIQERQK